MGAMLIAFLGVDYMIFTVNGNNWILQYVRPSSEELRRSDGVYTLGVTDNTTKTVTIADNLSDRMTDKKSATISSVCISMLQKFSKL